MVQIICDICGKPIPNGEIYDDAIIKQKRSGKWRDIDVCKSCARIMIQEIKWSTSPPSIISLDDFKAIIKKENSNGTDSL